MKHSQSDIWLRVSLCGAPTVGGLALAWVGATPWLGLGVAFGGAVARLTPQGIWTKELGWRTWNEVLVTLERNSRGRGWNAHVLHLHRPGEFVPCFYEGVGMLDISEVELRGWLSQYARVV